MVNTTKNKGGAPKGNKNAAKNKPWQDAINRALARYGEGSKDGGLNKLADKLLIKCADGDLSALKELGDRIEGKPAQSVTLAGDEDNPLHVKTELANKAYDFLGIKPK